LLSFTISALIKKIHSFFFFLPSLKGQLEKNPSRKAVAGKPMGSSHPQPRGPAKPTPQNRGDQTWHPASTQLAPTGTARACGTAGCSGAFSLLPAAGSTTCRRGRLHIFFLPVASLSATGSASTQPPRRTGHSTASLTASPSTRARTGAR